MMILKIHNRNRSVFRGEHHRKKIQISSKQGQQGPQELSSLKPLKTTPSPKNTGIGHEDIIKNVKIEPQTTDITFPAEPKRTDERLDYR